MYNNNRNNCLFNYVLIHSLRNFVFIFHIARSCSYRYDAAAFMFSLSNKPDWGPTKLSQTGLYSSQRRSIYSCSSYGPTFGGGHDFHITNYASSHSRSNTNLGFTYGPPTGHSYGSTFARTFLAGTYIFRPTEVEVFYQI